MPSAAVSPVVPASVRPSLRRAVVLTRDNLAPHAGGKAPADVAAICASLGITTVSLPVIPDQRFSLANLRRFVLGTLTLVVRGLPGRVPDILIVQHPIVGTLEKRLILGLFRRSRKIALIHDLDVLRKPTNHTFDDLWFLRQFDVLIAHNEAMRRFLAAELPGPAVLVLGVFDFLVPVDGAAPPPCAAAPTRLFVIGNLHPMKAAYLYKAGALERPIAAFGPNCVVENLPESVRWQGVVADGRLPIDLIDGFGLVWDGDSPDALEGVWGAYLQYNAPHKLSFYIVLGLPVIVPRSSAMAEFVRREGIGFEADSLPDAAHQVGSVTPAAWQGYCRAVRRLREKITSGFHTAQAVGQAMALLGRDKTHSAETSQPQPDGRVAPGE